VGEARITGEIFLQMPVLLGWLSAHSHRRIQRQRLRATLPKGQRASDRPERPVFWFAGTL